MGKEKLVKKWGISWLVALATLLVFMSMAIESYAGTGSIWELVPKPDSEFRNGSFTAVQGMAGPQGVMFKLKRSSEIRPVILALDTVSSDGELQLSLRKADNKVFARFSTHDGHLLQPLRTGEDLYLMVSSEKNVRYALSVWVGSPWPQLRDAPVVPMSRLNGSVAPEATSVSTLRTSTESERESSSRDGRGDAGDMLIYLLLGGILLALIVIAVRLGGRRPPSAPLWLFLWMGACYACSSPPSFAGEEDSFRPRLVDRESPVWEKIQHSLRDMKKYSKQLEEVLDAASKAVGSDSVINSTNLKALRDVAEVFGFIDPREKAVQPDYHPSGMPALGGHIYDDPKATTEMQDEFDDIQKRIAAAQRHLEGNYVTLVKTKIYTDRFKELADAAAGLSPFAGLLWTSIKANPNDSMNKAEANFYKKYDEGQKAGLDYLLRALRDLAAFESKYYGARDYYAIYCQPYYNFMLARYARSTQ